MHMLTTESLPRPGGPEGTVRSWTGTARIFRKQVSAMAAALKEYRRHAANQEALIEWRQGRGDIWSGDLGSVAYHIRYVEPEN
jgi:hypothetical protein